jgi:CelD/BcsL family acetyltransferase involved in cellulose biosynthesis
MSINGIDSTDRLQVIATDPQTDARWVRFVAAHPDGSVYHHPAWLRALEKEYRQRGVHLACVDATGQFLAVLPMLHTKGLPVNLGGSLTGRRLSSLPRTPLAGPLSTDSQATLAILQAAVLRARQDPGIQLQIKAQGPDLDGLVGGVVCAPWRLSYLLQLPENPGEPFRIPKSDDRARIKWSVNKATKLGVRVRPAETEGELEEWYTLYLETMRRNVVPPRSYRFFAALWELLRPSGMMELLLAEEQLAGRKRIIAGSVFLLFGRTVSYVFNGSRLADLTLRPNDIIQWQAIGDACKRGFKYFDFGEVPDGNCDLAKFKSKWGAQPTRLHRYYSTSPDAESAAVVKSHGYGTRLPEAAWRRLPLKATAWLGDRLYSYL